MNKYTHARVCAHTDTDTDTHTHATCWQDSQVRSPKVSPADKHLAKSSHTTKSKNPLYMNPSVFSPLSISPFLPLSLHPSLSPSLPPSPRLFLSFC